MKLIIENCKCPSWNEMRAVKHWAQRYKVINSLERLVNYYLLAKYRSGKFKIKGKANICIEAHFKNSNRRDPDNLFVKPVIDAIVNFGILPDDNGDVVESLTLMAKRKMPNDQIIIYINE